MHKVKICAFLKPNQLIVKNKRMSIQISYHGPYRIHRHRDKKGNYDLTALRHELVQKVPNKIAQSSGIYIVYQRVARGKLSARYVGVNTTKNLLHEALLKSHILHPDVLGNQGSRWLLLLVCRRPDQMPRGGFKRALLKLEKALILDLALKKHPLENVQHQPRKPRFDFQTSNRSSSAQIFKNLVKHKPPHV